MKRAYSFPQTINGYSLIKVISARISIANTAFAHYQDKFGNLGFAKLIIKSQKPWESYWSNNEATLYPLLSKLTPVSGKTYVPKLLGVYEGKGYEVILLSKIIAKPIENVTSSRKLYAFNQAFIYLAAINKRINSLPDYRKISSRHGIYFWLLFPIYFFLSILRHNAIRKCTGAIITTYIRSFYQVAFRENMRFIHRDLNQANILLKGSQVWLIDFQSSVRADIRFEIANCAINLCHDQKTRQRFYKLPCIRKELADNASLYAYQFYCLYAALFEISQKSHIPIWLRQYLMQTLHLHLSHGKVEYVN